MAKKLEFWGVACTIIYLLIMTATVLFKLDGFLKLGLNELGDFLAGVFGPVAFLWLVLGFLQQGRELKLSSDALHLQAKELKNSVEQQQSIVRIANEQLMITKKSSEPKFILQYSKYLSVEGGVLFSFKLSNFGHLTACVNIDWVQGSLASFPMLSFGETKDFNLQVNNPQKDFSVFLSVSYLNDMGGLAAKNFQLGFHKSLAYEDQWSVFIKEPLGEEVQPKNEGLE